ncbi:MAG: hypothetical protein RR262_16195 [Clostridium sp.]
MLAVKIKFLKVNFHLGMVLAIYICEEKIVSVALLKADNELTNLFNKGDKKWERKYL